MFRQLINWRVWLGVAVSLLCLWLAVRDVPLTDFREYVERANYWWLIPGILCIVLTTALRGQRWTILLEGDVSVNDAFWAFSVGNLFNNLLPLRAGDVVRIIVLSDKNNVPTTQIATTVVVERLMDVATLLLLLLIILPLMNVPQFAVQVGITFGTLLLLAFFILMLLVHQQALSHRLLLKLLARLSFLPRDFIISRWEEMVAGLSSLTEISLAIKVIFYSLLSWIATIGFYAFTLVAFGSQNPLIESTFLVIVVSLAISLPSSPGFIGVFHLAGQQALVQPFGEVYTESTAFVVIFVAYIIVYVTTSLLGGIGLLYFGKRFFALSRRVVEETKKEPYSISP